jgi:hypothetical protein
MKSEGAIVEEKCFVFLYHNNRMEIPLASFLDEEKDP